MGVGHLALGFASKRWAPRTSLGLLLFAGVFVDVLWGLTILTGIEHARITPGISAAMPLDLYHLPYTHSLVTSIGWAALFGAVYYAVRRDRAVALLLAAGVLSHWVLDVVSHVPDMPIGLDGPLVGLGLWNSRAASIAVEGAMLVVGIAVYLRATRPRDRTARIALAVMVGLLFVSLFAGYLGPPPPSITPIAAGNILVCGLLAVFHWIDRRREPLTVG